MKKLVTILFAVFICFTVTAQMDMVQTAGSITTQNLNPLTGVPTAGSFVRLGLRNHSTVTIMVSGTYTGALSLQHTTDGGNTWVTYTNAFQLTLESTGAQSATITSAAVGAFTTDVAGLSDIRVSANAAVTGTAIIIIKAVTAVQQITLNGGVNQSGTWTMQIGNTPNTAPILANALIPTGTTTGDAGAKTTTFNGATQTNVNATGVTVVFNVGAVTGTTPTMVCKLQGSADAGTTWFDIPSATTASLIATGVFAIQAYPGLAVLAGTTTSGTTATCNGLLPRTWRVVYTIGGTTPSFTLTNVQLTYSF